MPWPDFRHAATRALLRRAFILWALLRVLFAALALAGDAIDFVPSIPAVAMVPLCGGVFLIDITRRGERALWANLGIAPSQLMLVSGGVAAISEAARLAIVALV